MSLVCSLLLCVATTICPALLHAQTAPRTGSDHAIKLNQIQVIGTHNSYHAGLSPSTAKWLAKRNPQAAAALDYSHPPLTQQFDNGVRQIELDVYADTGGGR